MSDEYKPKLVHMPGTELTPEVVLHRTLNKLDHIKAVTIIIQWKDDSYNVDWSRQTMAGLCMGSMCLQDEVMRELRGEPQE